MRVLIAGAGIGGLTAALSLHAAGHTDIRIVEAASELRPLGVGLNILPNAIRELTGLGVFDELAARSITTRELALYNRFGQLIWSEPRGRHAGYRWPQLSVNRARLQAVLAAAVRARLGADVITTDARMTGFAEQAGRVTVRLHHRASDTSTQAHADLLIGADGIRSAARAALYPDEGEPLWNRMMIWRGTTWGKPYLTGQSMIVAGDARRRIVFYPIEPGLSETDHVLINWVAGAPAEDGTVAHRGDWNKQAHLASVLHHFGDWRFDWLDVRGVVSAATQALEYPMVDRDPLPRWTFGRVTLLGDAAHPMYPMGSNGATQAIVDARALAYHLTACGGDVPAGLAAYELDRRPVTTGVQLANRRQGPEAVIDIAAERAPAGFNDVREVIPHDELVEVSTSYAKTCGFHTDSVNSQPGYSLRRLRGEEEEKRP